MSHRSAFALFFLLLVTLHQPAYATGVTPLPGWSMAVSANGVVMTTPCGGGDAAMAYVIYPAGVINEDTLEKWMARQVNSRVDGWSGTGGAVLERSGIVEQGNRIYTETVTFRDSAGMAWKTLIVGDANGAAGQVSAVLSRGERDNSDATFQAVIDHIEQRVSRGARLDARTLARQPLPVPPDATQAGPVVAHLDSSELRYLAQGRINTNPRRFVLTNSGRFFEGKVGNFQVQGTWQRTGDTIELAFGDGTFDAVPASCATAVQAPAASNQPAPAVRKCRTETRSVLKSENRMNCTVRGCSSETVSFEVEEPVQVCD